MTPNIPIVHVSKDAIEVDGRTWSLEGVDDVQLREHTDWSAVFVGMLASNALVLLGFVLLGLDAPMPATVATFALSVVIMGASWLSAQKRLRFYELVLRRGRERQIIAHSHAPEPVYRAWDELRQLRVVV